MKESRRSGQAPSPFERSLLRSDTLGIIREKSFFRGAITLASGRTSDFYLDMKPTMYHPRGIALISEMILDRISSLEFDYIGGLALGALPLITGVTMLGQVRKRPIPGFFVRKEIKDHGTRRKIEGLADGETLAGKRVVILDDVTTTGESAMLAVQAAQEAGATVILVLSVVDREEGAAETYSSRGIAFEALYTASEFLNRA